jgi:hypothetical protein
MPKQVFKFSVEVYGDVNSGDVMPIYDDYGELAGGAVCLFGNVIKCFVGGDGFPAALAVSSESNLWITPRQDKRGQLSHCILSEFQLGPDSSKVSMAATESIDDNFLLEDDENG